MNIDLLRNTFRRFKRRINRTVELRHVHQVIFEDDTTTILYTPGDGADLILSFTGIGHSTGGIDLQTPEFSKSDFQSPMLFVIDKHRSWGNRLNWNALEGIIREKRTLGRLVVLGNSMGGFLAILAADRFGADVSIAFAPQWSVNPKVVPFEDRWNKYRKNIEEYSIFSLEHSFANDCKFHVFCGSDARDARHLELFPTSTGNIVRYHLAGGGHSVSAGLKEFGILYPVIAACIEDRNVAELLIDAGMDHQVM